MCETTERRMVEATANYILDLPSGAQLHHSKLLRDGNVYKYYKIEDDEGERYVYTDERSQEFNRKMQEAAKKRRKTG